MGNQCLVFKHKRKLKLIQEAIAATAWPYVQGGRSEESAQGNNARQLTKKYAMVSNRGQK